jgi:hypothetical protein
MIENIKNFATQCTQAKNEEDIRVATNIYLQKLTEHLGLNNRRQNEVTYIYGGRADSVYQNLIFEFKAPKKFSSKVGIDQALYGRDENDRGLFHYLINSTLQEDTVIDDESFCEVIKTKIGIAFDGTSFIFVRFKYGNELIELFDENKTKWSKNINKNQPLYFDIDISRDFASGIRKLSLLARSTKKKILSADNLLLSFSNETELSQATINYLYLLLNKGIKNNPRINTLYLEWNRIFGEIYGEVETDFTNYRTELIEMYQLPKNLDIKKCLFVLQTFYSIVIKLIIQNLLFSLKHPLEPVKKPKHKSDLSSLFSGGNASENLVDNFFEIHFFV